MKIESEFIEWGPYLSFGTDASTEMRISWRTEQYLMEKRLKYGITKECELEIVEEYTEPRIHHCVIINGLKPSTTYYYHIFSGNDDRDETLYSFQTGPSIKTETEGTNEINFAVLSDIHANGIERIKINSLFPAINRNIPQNQFFIVLGDSVDDGLREINYQYFFENTNEWLAKVPLMNTTGNHDCSTREKYARFLSIWNHPFVNSREGGFYSFRYDNVMFIMLDSDNGGNSGLIFSDNQMDWLQKQLEDAKAQNLWIFVCFHRQMYSTGDFSMEPLMHQYLRPLFDEYHVDCVMYGHDHNYQFFWTNRNASWGGTKYFVCGACGGPERSELKILGDNQGRTIYIWPGLTYSYERDGILPQGQPLRASSTAHRMDEICKDQIYSVLLPNFVHFKIQYDTCNIRCIGFQDQIYHTFSFTKTKKT